MTKCPLCNQSNPNEFFRDRDRAFLQCPNCALIFVTREDLLSAQEEKARYDLHQNNPDDPGYRQFLSQVIHPLMTRMGPPPAQGLDFGSGPEPVLVMMLEEQGYAMTWYDPYYAPNPEALDKTYDFITCTETFEHFYHPDKEWCLLLQLLKPGGWLGIMTKLIDDIDQFSQMEYIQDRTHVGFFSRKTFQFLADQDDLKVEFFGDNVIILHKRIKMGLPVEDNDFVNG